MKVRDRMVCGGISCALGLTEQNTDRVADIETYADLKECMQLHFVGINGCRTSDKLYHIYTTSRFINLTSISSSF